MPRRPLLGNWYEEEAYANDRKRMMQGRSGGEVEAGGEVANIMAKLKHHSAPYPIAPLPEDGLLRFFNPVMLQNAETLGYLSVDLDDRKRGATGWQVGVTTATAEESTLRNTVVLVPAVQPATDSYPVPQDERDVVHYGQPFYIMTLPELCDDPLSLVSEFRTPGNASRVSGLLQNAYYSPDGGSAGAMWCADYVLFDYQEDMRDHPVRADDPLILRHNMTNAPLASHKKTLVNDFGPENEVGCGRLNTQASKRKIGALANSNTWMFIHEGQGLNSTFGAAGGDSKEGALAEGNDSNANSNNNTNSKPKADSN